MRNDASWIAIPLGIIFFASGYWFALKLIAIPSLQIFKVMNIIGLVCDLAGVAILSKFIMSNRKAKAFVVERLAPQLTNLFAGVTTGMVAASFIGPIGPSQMLVRDFSIALQLSLAWPGVFYVFFWTKKTKLSAAALDLRVTLVGSFFLVFVTYNA